MAKTAKNESKAVATITEPAEHIWLAGLGAMATAEEQGSKLFESLMKKGKVVQKHNTARLDDLKDRVKDLRSMPGNAMEKINENVDSGMAAVLHRLGVPTKREIGALTRRVEELTRSLEKKKATKARLDRRRSHRAKAAV